MNWFLIVFFIISICAFLITHYYRLKQDAALEHIETFETEIALTPSEKLLQYHGVKMNYLDVEQAKKLIVKNGEYLQGMNQANLTARDCLSIDDLYNKYRDAFDPITDTEQKIVDAFILKLLENIKQYNIPYYNYVVHWLKIISIAKAKRWLESGMPHTLETTIVMDANWFVNPRKTTFIHEITHVHQRQTPMDFEDLYPSLGYLYNPVDIKGLDAIYPLNRNNPDGMSKYWLWSRNGSDTYWWIGAIFKTAIPSSLSEVNLMALKLDKEPAETNNAKNNYIFYYLKQNPTPLSNLKEFISFFGENPNNYHPNEMTAKFSEWYLMETLRSNQGDGDEGSNIYEYENYEGYRIYKKYFEKMINTYYR